MLFTMAEDLRSQISISCPQGVWPASNFGWRLAAFVSKLELAGKGVLDVGCGSGIQAIVAARCGAHVSASDISQAAVEATLANAQRSRVNVEARVGGGATPWRGRKFDLVICNGPTFEPVDSFEAERSKSLQRLRPIPKVTLDLFRDSKNLLTEDGRIIGMVCGPYSGKVVEAAAAESSLCMELVLNLEYLGGLDAFGGSFERTVAEQAGLVEPLADGAVCIRAAIFAVKQLSRPETPR